MLNKLIIASCLTVKFTAAYTKMCNKLAGYGGYRPNGITLSFNQFLYIKFMLSVMK